MRFSVGLGGRACLWSLTFCLVAAGAWADDDAGGGPFAVRQLADGVYLFEVGREDVEHTNSLVVELTNGLLVVDAQPTPAAATRFLEALSARTPSSIRYLVLSHPHAEVGGGIASFPAGTQVIASSKCANALADPDHDFGAEARLRSPDPDAWREPERPHPGLVLHGVLELNDPRNRVRILPMPAAHAVGELSVLLPDAKISHVGATLFVRGNPYPGGGTITDWIGTLNRLVREDIEQFIPERGPAVDKQTVRLDRDALAWLRGHFAAARVDSSDPDEIAAILTGNQDLGRYFSGSPGPSFFDAVLDQMFEENRLERRKRSGSDE